MRIKAHIYFILLFISFCHLSTLSVAQFFYTIPEGDPNFTEVWEYDFDEDYTFASWDGTTVLDENLTTTGWYAIDHFSSDDGSPEVRLKENVSFVLDDEYNDIGAMRMVAVQEEIPVGSNAGLRKYSGAGVAYYGNGDINNKATYGFLEARMRFSNVYGLWQSFWTFEIEENDTDFLCEGPGGLVVPTDNYDEIDVLEMIPGKQIVPEDGSPEYFHDEYIFPINYHLQLGVDDPYNCFDYVNITTPLEGIDIVEVMVDDYTQYHNYGIEWDAENIYWYIDGEIVGSTAIEDEGNGIDLAMRVLFTLSLNDYVQSGAQYDGNENDWKTWWFDVPSGYQSVNSTSVNDFVFPANCTKQDADLPDRHIDWVRYRRMKFNCEKEETYSSLDLLPVESALNYHNFEVKKSITIDGTNPIIMNGGSPEVLRATDFVTIHPGFQTSGEDLHIIITDCTN